MLTKAKSWVENKRNALVLFVLGAFLLFTLFDRGGIHYSSFFGLAILLLPLTILASLGKKRNSFSKFRLAWLSLVGFGVFFVLSYAFSLTPNYGFPEIVIFLGGGMVAFLLSRLDFEEGQIERFLQWLLILAFLTSIIGIYFYITEPFNRLAGTFRDFKEIYHFFPNALANFLLIVSPAVAYFVWKVKGSRKLIYIVLAVIISGSIFLTYSRGALFALLGVLFVWIIISAAVFERSALRRIFCVLFLLLAGFMFFLEISVIRGEKVLDNNLWTEKITLEANEGRASVDERFYFWWGAFLIMKDFPILGSGPYSFRFVYPQYQSELLTSSDHPHNILLKIGAENGIFALLFFVVFLMTIFFYWVSYWETGEEQRRWRIKGSSLRGTIFVMLSIGFLHNLVDYNFNFVTNFLVYWIALGFLFSLLTKEDGALSKIKMVCFWKRDYISIGLLAISIVIFIVGVFETYNTYQFRQATNLLQNHKYEDSLTYFDHASFMLFKRNYYVDLALAYDGLFERYQDQKWLDKASWVLSKHLKMSKVDAFAWNLFGEIELKKEEPDEALAEEYFRKALSLDSMNNFRYYLNLLGVVGAEDSDFAARLKELISIYIDKLRINAHMTILTDNPKSALGICKKVYGSVAAECVKLSKIWKEEERKFEKAYK